MQARRFGRSLTSNPKLNNCDLGAGLCRPCNLAVTGSGPNKGTWIEPFHANLLFEEGASRIRLAGQTAFSLRLFLFSEQEMFIKGVQFDNTNNFKARF